MVPAVSLSCTTRRLLNINITFAGLSETRILEKLLPNATQLKFLPVGLADHYDWTD